jgi:broad specificity phosphatase PhoE
MRLIMVRHGRPEWQLPFGMSLSRFEQVSVGYDAAHLSAKGMRALEPVAERLPPALILSSDLPRARETAETISRGRATVECDPVFRELRGPHIATPRLGRLWAPAAMWALTRRCCWLFGIGEFSEGPRAAWHRVAQATSKLLTRFETEETIILVSHAWFLILLALHLRQRGFIEQGPLIPRFGYGAVTEYLLRAR